MSEFEKPSRAEQRGKLTVDDVREMTYATTPHFALHVRNRLRRLIAPLDASDPARQLAELEITRLEELAVAGQHGKRDSALPRLDA